MRRSVRPIILSSMALTALSLGACSQTVPQGSAPGGIMSGTEYERSRAARTAPGLGRPAFPGAANPANAQPTAQSSAQSPASDSGGLPQANTGGLPQGATAPQDRTTAAPQGNQTSPAADANSASNAASVGGDGSNGGAGILVVPSGANLSNSGGVTVTPGATIGDDGVQPTAVVAPQDGRLGANAEPAGSSSAQPAAGTVQPLQPPEDANRTSPPPANRPDTTGQQVGAPAGGQSAPAGGVSSPNSPDAGARSSNGAAGATGTSGTGSSTSGGTSSGQGSGSGAGAGSGGGR